MFIGKVVFDSSQLAAASRIFSSSVFKEMAKSAQSPLFARLIKQMKVVDDNNCRILVGQVFDDVFNVLKNKAYRHEYAYKAAVTKKILFGVHSLNTAVMLSEFRVANSKADLVILNGTSTVYEIKSERDKLDRLEGQIKSYLKVFAKVNVITGENHLDEILNNYDPEIGVLLLTDRYQIKIVRKPVERKDRIEPAVLFESLTRKEHLEILTRFGEPLPNVPNTELHAVLKEKIVSFKPSDLHDVALETLKSTRSLLGLKQFTAQLPESLYAIALTIKVSRQEQSNILTAIGTPTCEALHWG
ncbi:sce7726 family protein [uncultured Deefgea sp.]|uniref:sce7726 family protein n=1 Tax=uncultured Deefgea sp. TaxID=1304914 RepID=UPI00263450FE|nr:sce7726 family protein [uncultured Deefgea sp.]